MMSSVNPVPFWGRIYQPDGQRIHIVGSEPINPGVADVPHQLAGSRRCHSNFAVLARSAVSLATHRKQAKAARKRSSGLALSYLHNSLLMGRYSRSTGGETKSLCREAAGITPSQPSACAAAAYPTTGVRRAQELSLSLRSSG